MAKYNLDFNTPLINMNGEEVGHLGNALAAALEMRQDGDRNKNTDWAEELYNREILELDRADRASLGEWIKSTGFHSLLGRRLEEVLEKSPITKEV